MKEEIKALWVEYKTEMVRREHEYARDVIQRYGQALYAPNKANQPSFEGFMDWITEPHQ